MAIPRDVGFGLNDFHEMQVYSEGESIARYLLNILLMRPGNMPGLPHIGLNVRDLLYHSMDDIDSQDLKDKIFNQCNALLPNIVSEEIFVGVVEYNEKSFLLIRIPVLVDKEREVINYAFYQTEAREIKFDFEIEK